MAVMGQVWSEDKQVYSNIKPERSMNMIIWKQIVEVLWTQTGRVKEEIKRIKSNVREMASHFVAK